MAQFNLITSEVEPTEYLEVGKPWFKGSTREWKVVTSLNPTVWAVADHLNLALLDTYAQTETNISDAVTKKHANTLDHANTNDPTAGEKAVLANTSGTNTGDQTLAGLGGIAHSLATAVNDFLVASGAGAFVKKTSAETKTILLAEDLQENDSIKLDPALSVDGKYNGITETGTAGIALAFGDICYLAVLDSRWELAKADVAATSFGKVGICVQAAAGDGSATTMLLYGKVRADAAFPVLTIGAPVFISAATAGDITSTAPTGTTNFVVRIIGYGNTADELFFCPDNSYVELA